MNLAIIKVTGVLVGKISRTALKGTRILFYGRVPKFISTPKRYKFNNNNNITGTVNFNSNKDNFRTLSLQGRFSKYCHKSLS